MSNEDESLFAVEFLVNESHYASKISGVQIVGNWGSGTPINLRPLNAGVWSNSVLLPKGDYQYYVLINGNRYTDKSEVRQSTNAKIIDATTFALKYGERPRIEHGLGMDTTDNLSDEPYIFEVAKKNIASVFVAEFARFLNKAEAFGVSAEFEDTSIDPEINVSILRRITTKEAGLPASWVAPNGVIYKVAVKFDFYISSRKSSKVLQLVDLSANNWKMVEDGKEGKINVTGIDKNARDSFVQFHQRTTFSCHKGPITVSIVPIRHNNQTPVVKALLVVLIDWDNAPIIENELYGMEWGGLEVITARDRILNNAGRAYAHFHKTVCVGSSGGGIGMTIGVIMEDSLDTSQKYIIMCAHGFNGRTKQCFYPPVSKQQEALNELETMYEDEVDARGTTDHARVLKLSIDGLKRAAIVMANGQYGSTNSLQYLSIGTCIKKNDELDLALIKVRLSSREGFQKSLNNPPNLLRGHREGKKATEMKVNNLQGVKSLTKEQLEARFSPGMEGLAKLGATTGYTRLCVDDNTKVAGSNNRIHLQPLRRSKYMDQRGREQKGVDSGDSSAPVFVEDTGEVVGMISANYETQELYFMVPWSIISDWLRTIGQFQFSQ